MTSVWDFPDRGKWATHDAKWRGNWSPYIPRNLILRYTKEGDTVLDQFAGGGTTLVESKLLNRNCIGVDINDKAIDRCREKVNFEHEGANGKIYIKKGDARNLDFVTDGKADFVCTHPPYADIIKYSEDIDGDLSRMPHDNFLRQMKPVTQEAYRVLKDNSFCAVLIGDMRLHGCVVPLGFELKDVFLSAGFKLKEIIIKEQHKCRATGFWKTNSVKYNFLLLAHEYLFVFGSRCPITCTPQRFSFMANQSKLQTILPEEVDGRPTFYNIMCYNVLVLVFIDLVNLEGVIEMSWGVQDNNDDFKVKVSGDYVKDEDAAPRTDFLIIDKKLANMHMPLLMKMEN